MPEQAPTIQAQELEVEEMIRGTDHFGHREAAGIVVDLFWDRRDLHDEFRVEVKDRRDGTRFVLYPATGREAIRPFITRSRRRPASGRREGRPGLTRSSLPAAGRSQITAEGVLT